MRIEMPFDLEVTGDYIPGSKDRPVGDGTWEPGERGMMVNMQVLLQGRDITDDLTAEQIDILEDAWLEDYETRL